MFASFPPIQVFKPSQGELISHVFMDSRHPLNAIYDSPSLILVSSNIEHGEGYAQQQRFNKPAFALTVPETAQPLKIWREINFLVSDTRDDLFYKEGLCSNPDQFRVERLCNQVLKLLFDATLIFRGGGDKEPPIFLR